MNNLQYEPVIGLEVHAQLKTNSKIFCGCSVEFGALPNSNICPVCTGQPGVLPVLNKKAVEFIIKTGLALSCKINRQSIFARKQYFYPDLPKNYQISQYELPIAENGNIKININGVIKNVRIKRIHLEEDAGKLLHMLGSRELDYSLVDYNRTGIPLMEIVSEADISSPEEAYQYLCVLKDILEYLEVSDCNMEEGKFRCDANISVRPVGQKEFGVKIELKNMNSLTGVREALEYEIERQIEIVSQGGSIVQETRLWDADKKSTFSMRKKEEAHDYRYFPDPDLVPLEIDDDFINNLKKELPELPDVRKKRFITEYELSEYDAGVLTSQKALADFYEETLSIIFKSDRSNVYTKTLANWVTTELLGKLNATSKTIKESPIKPESLAELIVLLNKGTISGKIAKIVFSQMFDTRRSPNDIINEQGLVQLSDENQISKYCDEAISENPKAVLEYQKGKTQALGALVGSVMKKTKGRANPQIVNKILKDKLG